MLKYALFLSLSLALVDGPALHAQERSATTQPDTARGLYSPSQHALYDGRFKIVGHAIYHVGSLNDSSPWDHMDNNAERLRKVSGEVSIDVNEISNEGEFRAEMELPDGTYRIEMERFNEFL